MAIAITLRNYLDEHGSKYEVLTHPPTHSTDETVRACHLPGERVAKGVVLKTEDGYVLALLPASRHIEFRRLKECMNERVGLATEAEIETLFSDCDLGAVPAIGPAYGLKVIIDDSLMDQPDLYFEGGDHKALVHMSAGDLRELLGETPHAAFSARA